MSSFASIFGGTTGGGGAIEVQDEGVTVDGYTTCINFVGADVQATPGSTLNKVDIYIPPPAFLSHWNTSDGSNGNQAVSESISRTTARISTPAGGEGTPFSTNGWAGTNQAASINANATFTTPANTTGFGGDSTIEVEVFDADGVTLLDSFTTPSITSNNAGIVSPSGEITVTITGYGADSTRFQARASVLVDIAGVFTDNGLSGGRYHVAVTHNTDTTTDGTGSYVYTQTDVFYDANPTTPEINGTTTIGEGATVITKHLSGLEYYDFGSEFQVDVNDIDDHNQNTSRTSASLLIRGPEYGLPNLDLSPFGTGSANFVGWTNNHDQDNVNYSQDDWTITAVNYRFTDTDANITSQVRDTWNPGTQDTSPNASVLIDTFGSSSTDLFEPFNDEDYRDDGYFTGSWNSEATLGVDGYSGDNEAMVYGGRLIIPNTSLMIDSNTPNTDWTGHLPNVGGPNPDYTALGGPATYYRAFPDSTGLTRSQMNIIFTGTFVVDATTDLINSDLELTFYKIGGFGNIGAPPTNVTPLFAHGAEYNILSFDDGVTDGQIRSGTSSGNNVQCVFQTGTEMEDGVYCQITINNTAIKIDSMSVSFS